MNKVIPMKVPRGTFLFCGIENSIIFAGQNSAVQTTFNIIEIMVAGRDGRNAKRSGVSLLYDV